MKVIDLNVTTGVNWPALELEARSQLDKCIDINMVNDGAVVRFLLQDNSVSDTLACQSLLDIHNPIALTAEQAAEQRADAARTAIRAKGADGVRALGLPELSEYVALIVEALGLDLG